MYVYFFVLLLPQPEKNAITVSQSIVFIVYCNCHFLQALHLVMHVYKVSSVVAALHFGGALWVLLMEEHLVNYEEHIFIYWLPLKLPSFMIDLSVVCAVKTVVTSFYRMISILEPVILWISEQVALVSTVWDAGGNLKENGSTKN